MNMTHTVYVKLDEITELTHKDILLKDVAQVYCRDQNIQNKCSVCRIMTVRSDEAHRYVMSALDVTKSWRLWIRGLKWSIWERQTLSLPTSRPLLLPMDGSGVRQLYLPDQFFGAAFAIMTFNNDVSVTSVFHEIYRLVMGYEAAGFTVLEASYCVGLSLGIMVFFNHISAGKVNTDPTPLEVEMRLYEENISKTLIDNAQRKEKKIDIS